MAVDRAGNPTNQSQRAEEAEGHEVRSEQKPRDSAGNSPKREDAATADEPQVELVSEGDQAAPDRIQAELAACQDRILRLQAEMENLRRRTVREIADERRYGTLAMVRDLVEVLDNVDRAIEAGKNSADSASLLEGFQLVARQLRSLLDRHHVKPIAAEGEPFDPNLHEAILQQPSPEPNGTVILMTQQGYQLHDRVVRPSQVIVSAGQEE